MSSAVAVAALASCGLPDLYPEPKACPCLGDFYCRIESRECIAAGPAPTHALGCIVYTDNKLYCANRTVADMFMEPAAAGPVVNHLRTVYSWFTCWDDGEPHAGGNTTWFFTDGDDRGAPYAWLPAVDVQTPQAFNADPEAYGFPQCLR